MIDIKSNKSNQNTLLAIAQAILIVGSATMSSSYLIGHVNAQVDPNGDDDRDGLKNSWESNGIPYTGVDGQQRLYKLPDANPNHKNLYVEVDYMNGHRPNGGYAVFGSIEDVRRAFRLAPVSNPDGNPGINLFVQLDENITHSDTTDLTGLKNNIKPTWFGTATENRF